MITLTAKIDLISDDSGTLGGVSSNLFGNNISSEIGAIKGVKSQGSNPFILGASKLGDGSTFSDSVDYFIGGVASNENGVFETPYEITISGTDITSFTIAFDTTNNRHPNTIKVDNVEYADDDAIFTISNLPSANSHTIIIDNWNTPNYPLVITGIYVEISINIDYRNLISLNRSINYRSDNKLPSYGVISNTGNLEFNDLDGEIKDYAEQLLLTSDLNVVITLTNTLAKIDEQVGVFQTENWDYDNDNRRVTVSLKDDLEEWQDIYVEGITIDPRKIYDEPLSYIYNYLWEITSNRTYGSKIGKGNYNMLALGELDQDTQNVLNNVYTKYPLLNSGNLWQQWTKLCQVCQLHIYKDNQGIIVCRYNGGN